MRIALGSDHRGAKFAKMLTYNVFMRNHYVHQTDESANAAEEMPGAYLIENAAVSDDFDADDAQKTTISPIVYSLAPEKTEEAATGSLDYPDVAAAVAEAVATGKADRGILICGTGIGMCITANKFKGVRAASCFNEVAAELSRRHNNANVLCLSGDFLSETTVEAIVRLWLVTPFDGGRHARRVDRISEIETETGL